MSSLGKVIPAELRSRDQFVCWRYEEKLDQKTGETRWTKPPCQVDGRYADSTNPSTWTSFERALAGLEQSLSWTDRKPLSGIGFVLTGDDPFTGVDLDHCVDLDTGCLEPWAREIVEELNSYTELSPSGTGVRIFIKATLPPVGRKRGDFEVYEEKRYLTITGNVCVARP